MHSGSGIVSGRGRNIQVSGPHTFVMSRGVMFCEIIGKVQLAGCPEYGVLVLVNAILKPIEAHVNGFGSALFDSVAENALSALIVCLNGGGRLGVALGQ